MMVPVAGSGFWPGGIARVPSPRAGRWINFFILGRSVLASWQAAKYLILTVSPERIAKCGHRCTGHMPHRTERTETQWWLPQAYSGPCISGNPDSRRNTAQIDTAWNYFSKPTSACKASGGAVEMAITAKIKLTTDSTLKPATVSCVRLVKAN